MAAAAAAAAVLSAQSLLRAQNQAQCLAGSSGDCFAECKVGAACPSGLSCDPGCGLCGCSTCPACEASTHVGSWHIANIARALVKLVRVGGAAITAADQQTMLCAAELVSTQYAAFSGISAQQAAFTTRDDWIQQGLYKNLFFDDLGWWALALYDLYDLMGDATVVCSTPMGRDRALAAALNITAINSSAYSNLCGGGVEWNCPNWTVDSAQKNTVTNMLNVITLLRAVPHLANPPPGAPTALAADYLGRVQTIWKWYSTNTITNPTLHYGNNQAHAYVGHAGLFNVLPTGQVVLGDAMSTSQLAKYSSCTPCTSRMQPGGTCGDIQCDVITMNQWTYNYGVVIAALLEMDKASSQLDLTAMGPHTDFVALALAVADTSVASPCLAVTTYFSGVAGLDAASLGFFSDGVVQENCQTWAGNICNADQFIFRGIYLDWLADLVSYLRAAKRNADSADRYAALIASTAAALVANTTVADGASVHPFQWSDATFDWCKPCDSCNVTAADCASFYAANGHNRFEVSNQAAGLKALTAALQVGSSGPPCPIPVCPICPVWPICPACPSPTCPACPACPACPSPTCPAARAPVGALVMGSIAAAFSVVAVGLLVLLVLSRRRTAPPRW